MHMYICRATPSSINQQNAHNHDIIKFGQRTSSGDGMFVDESSRLHEVQSDLLLQNGPLLVLLVIEYETRLRGTSWKIGIVRNEARIEFIIKSFFE